MKLPKKIGEPEILWRGSFPNKVVSSQDFQFPDGSIKAFYLWGKAKTPVIVFPITDRGNVIVTRQWRPGSDGQVYELAGGHQKPGQTIEEALADELREELGYAAGCVEKLPEFWLDPPSNNVTIAGYLATGCRKVGEPQLEQSEVIERVEMTLNDWLKLCTMVPDRKKDAKTLAATLLVLPRIGKIAF